VLKAEKVPDSAAFPSVYGIMGHGFRACL